MDNKNDNGGTEMDTFLPQDGSNMKDGALTGKYKIQIASRDAEAPLSGPRIGFDPFKERQLEKPSSDCDTLTHLLKASLGTGILCMPDAFKNSGLVFGVIGTIIVSLICTHCAYVLVKCAHKMYFKLQKTSMTFADVAEAAFVNGPPWARPYSNAMRYLILISVFITYYGTCSVYTVIVAENLNLVAKHYFVNQMDTRAIMAILLIPMLLLSWVPNFKYLAPISMVANAFMAIGIGITFYYLVIDLPPVQTVRMAPENIAHVPKFLSTVIFAIEAIGVVLPLENDMRTPQHFTGLCGVLNRGMSGVTLVYILLGFLGYLRYGEKTAENITWNLGEDQIPAQVVNVLIALAVLCTFALQFFVCLEIAWNGVKDRFKKRPLFANYVLRTVLVIGAVAIAIAVPKISPFMGLIGAFCFSILGLVIPVFIETVAYWDDGFGPLKWVAIKNVIIIVVGCISLIFGSREAVAQIIKMYSSDPNAGVNATIANATTTIIKAIANATTEATIR